jgi:YesN/AraC family two-component response regulator
MYKVALVDDEPWNLKGLEQLADWNRLGFEIVYAGTKSTKAAEYLNSVSFHVLIADIRMPKLSGIELIRRIRARERGIVCIVISGYAEFQYAQEALQEGVFDYCLKPVKQQTLAGLLERVKAKLDGEQEERSSYFDDQIEAGLAGQADMNREAPRNAPEAQAELPAVAAAPAGGAQRTDNAQMNKLIAYIDAHYTDEIILRDLARMFYLNANYCCALFKKHLGATFSEYVNSLRIEKSKSMLLETDGKISYIAQAVGYNDYFYFNRVFKKLTGATPAKFRRGHAR